MKRRIKRIFNPYMTIEQFIVLVILSVIAIVPVSMALGAVLFYLVYGN